METIIQKYGIDIISLGFNCCATRYIKSLNLKVDNSTKLFDYIGSSTGGIIKFIKDGFEDVSDFTYIKSTNNKKYGVNLKYGFKFVHDIPQIRNDSNFYPDENFISEFKEKQARRLERFKDKLLFSEKLIFIRIESYKRNNINLPLDVNIMQDVHSKDFYDESEEIIQISNIIKELNSKMNFIIIYISRFLPNSFDIENNILRLKMLGGEDMWDETIKSLKLLFEINGDFINQSLSSN